MTTLQFAVVKTPASGNKWTPTLAWTFSALFRHSYSSCGLIKENIVCEKSRLAERKTTVKDIEAQTESSVAQDASEGSVVHKGVVVVVAVRAGSPAVCS